MHDLLAARAQMGMSLAFHIVFACAGIAMPLMMVIAEWLFLRSGEKIYLKLAKAWAKGTAILFAVGAVSGTVLSFELGLLWPEFMRFAGAIIGMPFSLEGFAFFTEAIFLGIYLYGWDRLQQKAHLAAGALVALSGVASAIFVVIANAWMNTPTGFSIVDGQPRHVDPILAIMNPNAFAQCLHMAIAAYAATGFAVAGIHAYMLMKDAASVFHRRALAIALAVGAAAALMEPLSGDLMARTVAHHQPEKLAAMEGQFQTEKSAPLRIGGIPDVKERVTRYSIDVPGALSILAFHDINATVKGLNDYPPDTWPNVLLVHVFFQIMVGCGGLMALLSLWAMWHFFRTGKLPISPLFLKAMVLSAPLGFIAVEAGWFVTELGRQPWVIYNVMRTADAVTPMPGLVVPFTIFTSIYVFLSFVVFWLLRRQVVQSI